MRFFAAVRKLVDNSIAFYQRTCNELESNGYAGNTINHAKRNNKVDRGCPILMIELLSVDCCELLAHSPVGIWDAIAVVPEKEDSISGIIDTHSCLSASRRGRLGEGRLGEFPAVVSGGAARCAILRHAVVSSRLVHDVACHWPLRNAPTPGWSIISRAPSR
jgi:hypothetical protein